MRASLQFRTMVQYLGEKRITNWNIGLMKLITLLILFFAVTTVTNGQDRRVFRGTIISSLVVDGSEDEDSTSEIETEIIFESRAIKIEDEVFSIVSRQFDGEHTTTFLCKKDGSDFAIVYKVGEFISVQEEDYEDTILSYQELEEL